jgi:hypothetical protein
MLTNQSMDQHSPLACLLVGQPTLRRTMKLGVLAALEQRTALRYTMPGMTTAETASYIGHHMKLVGRPDQLFTEDAIGLIHTTARGYPRAVNNLSLQTGRGDLPAHLDDPEHAPSHLPTHRPRQRRQVHPGPPGTVVTEPARILGRDGRLGETRQPHRLRHRRPQAFQRRRVAAATGRRRQPVHRGLCTPAGHEQDPICSGACTPIRQPAANAFHCATARISTSSVTCAYVLSVVCTSAWPSRRLTTCTGTPDNNSAVAWL